MESLTRPTGRLFAIVALSLGLSAVATAQDRPDITPGLWEKQMIKAPDGARMPDPAKMKAAMEKMQAQMASMPPEQRARMEQMMGHSGIAMSDTGMRMCLTSASLEHNGVPMENRPGCTTEIK
ncbi:MAG TPA: hypothetical protein VFM34_12765, partial [Moraxellaceae bacterium]|nr:hypothetical protein [Moraxellaceae bacterium]